MGMINLFVSEEFNKYNGYSLSYLLARYLDETIPREKLRKIIKSKSLIEELGDNILHEAVVYYKNQFEIK